jgi:HEAT repeat protein
MGGSTKSIRPDKPAGRRKGSALKHLRRYAFPFAALAAVSTMAGVEAARHGHTANLVHAASLSDVPAPPGALRSADEVNQLPPQAQAEYLLNRAIRRDPESLEAIAKNVDSWHGHLQNGGRLSELIHSALDSDDLGVRGAALDVDLAAAEVTKSAASVAHLLHNLRDASTDHSTILWQLGVLGNRGVEPKLVLAQLQAFVHDRDEQTRYAAVEGLAMLGSNAAIESLLDRFAHDPSPRVRKCAGYDLARGGMFTKEQRLDAIPNLLNFFDDDALDSATRGWVYGALRLITGAEIGNDAGAWRKWWANRDTSARKHPLRRTGILYA